jgi:hypothetical protein
MGGDSAGVQINAKTWFTRKSKTVFRKAPRRRTSLVVCLLALFGPLFPVPAQAVTHTERVDVNVTYTRPGYVYCRENLGRYRLTSIYTGHEYWTFLDSGDWHRRGSWQGTLIDVPLPLGSDKPTFTGHFAESFHINANQMNTGETFHTTIVFIGSDGSRFESHGLYHFSTSASGRYIEFEKLRCS